jgi:hypothetical protein
MSSIVDKRLEEYDGPPKVGGFSSKSEDMERMRKRAWAHSYHSPAPPHGVNKGPSPKNHVGEGDYMPKVRRTTT